MASSDYLINGQLLQQRRKISHCVGLSTLHANGTLLLMFQNSSLWLFIVHMVVVLAIETIKKSHYVIILIW